LTSAYIGEQRNLVPGAYLDVSLEQSAGDDEMLDFHGLPLPEQDRIKEQSNYSNDYSNLHNYSQIQTNVSKQNMGFLSTKSTVKDNREQAVP